MPKLIMLIGLPGSGKSTYAKKHLNNYIWCSSDTIRKELYGDENIQGNPKTVFEHLHNKVDTYLHRGFNVIYDATNVTRKNRRTIIEKFKHIADIEAHIIWAPYEECLKRDIERERSVGEDVIKKFLYRWESPNYDEGFSAIELIYNCDETWSRIEYSNKLLENMNIPHDNPHHSLGILDHCVKAKEFIMNKWPACCVLQEAGAYHDVGKPFTKSFKEDNVAHYYQHDNVGGYFVYGFYADSTICKQKAILASWLVSNHMQPYFNSKYYRNLDESYKKWLDMLHEADLAAH